MPIAEGKKRYYLTLDQESMDRAQELVKELKLPKQTVSLVIDEYLRSGLIPRLANTLEKKRSGEQLTFSDICISVGDSVLVTDGDQRGAVGELWVSGPSDDDSENTVD